MSGRIGVVQKPIPSTLRSSGCEEYEDDRGSSLLSAEMCEISENVEKTLRVAIQDICSSFGKNQKQFRAAIESRTKHEMVPVISVEVFPGVLQTEQKYIGKWREAKEAEMNIRQSETYCRPSGARYLVGSTLAPMCKSRYPVHFVAVDVKSTRTIVDQAFSVPKCVRLTRMSEKSYELLCYMFSAVPERTKEELESILGKNSWDMLVGTLVTLKDRNREDKEQQIIMQ